MCGCVFWGVIWGLGGWVFIFFGGGWGLGGIGFGGKMGVANYNSTLAVHKLEAKTPQLINLFDIPIGEGNILRLASRDIIIKTIN